LFDPGAMMPSMFENGMTLMKMAQEEAAHRGMATDDPRIGRIILLADSYVGNGLFDLRARAAVGLAALQVLGPIRSSKAA
jgi:hypothetical protein